jgi:hypothetical protein
MRLIPSWIKGETGEEVWAKTLPGEAYGNRKRRKNREKTKWNLRTENRIKRPQATSGQEMIRLSKS